MAWRDAAPARRRQELAAPLALLAGAIVFALVTGVGRGAPLAGVLAGQADNQSLPARHRRSVDPRPRRGHRLGDRALALRRAGCDSRLLIGVPGNIAMTMTAWQREPSLAAWERPYILSLPRLPVAKVLQAEHAYGYRFRPVDAAWIGCGPEWLLGGSATPEDGEQLANGPRGDPRTRVATDSPQCAEMPSCPTAGHTDPPPG